MSARSTGSAKKASCNNNLNRQLGLYSLAAAAAGVSMLALVQPAVGEVVNTKKTIPIPLAHDMPEPVKISLTNNGINDFSFNLATSSRSEGAPDYWRFLTGGGVASGNSIIGTSTFIPYASALPRGAK